MTVWLVLCGGLAGLLLTVATAEETSGPDCKEVYDLIRSHLVGITETQLNEAVVRGLVAELSPRVVLITNGKAPRTMAGPRVSKAEVFQGDILYIRVAQVGEGLSEAIARTWSNPGSTNGVNGLILDLRYAGGDDYAAAAAAADLFVKKEQPLLDCGNGIVRAQTKSNAICVPVAVLVNRQTTEAAEAMAAVLRKTGTALLLGGKTAGQAQVTQEFPLKNGVRLRIATAMIQLGDGSALTTEGLTPDIVVAVNPAEEQKYFADAFQTLAKTNLPVGTGIAGATPATRRPRLNEAELMRERREGLSEASLNAPRESEPEQPIVRDPVLARALDLLRGLALVRPMIRS